MNWSISYLLVLFFGILLTFESFGQGCSDAGICTLASFKPGSLNNIDTLQANIKVGVSMGSADHDISVFGTYIEYERNVSNKLDFNAKLTTLAQSGNNISVWGLSDVYLTGKYRFYKNLHVILGAKIPLTDGNRNKDNRPLPMDYQSSLGTVDAIAGLGFSLSNLQLMLGYQQPLIQNDNNFVSESYTEDNILSTFPTTNKFKRSSDALFRVSYAVPILSSLVITPSFLSVYHLSDDTYQASPGKQNPIIDSQGLTVNGNLYLDYHFLRRHSVQLSAGAPLVVRKVRPDGLTRGLVLSLEYKYTI